MRRMNLAGFATLCVLVVAGCTASTKLTSVWTEPGLQPNSVKRIMILAIAKKPGPRRLFEDTFAASIGDLGTTAVPSYTLLGDNPPDSAQIHSAITQGGFDGVMVTRLVDKQTVETYYPPTSTYVGAPSAYYGGWYGYYSTGYSYTTSPGYTVQNQVVSVETNLYRVSDAKLLWSALSQSWLEQAADPSTEIRPFVQQLVYGLENSKVITKTKKK